MNQISFEADLIGEVLKRTGVDLGITDPIARSYICLTQLLVERSQEAIDAANDKNLQAFEKAFDNLDQPPGIIQRILGAAAYLRQEADAASTEVVNASIRKAEIDARSLVGIVVAEEVRKAMQLEHARLEALQAQLAELNKNLAEIARPKGFFKRLFGG